MLYYIIQCYTMLYNVIQCDNILYYIILYYIILYYDHDDLVILLQFRQTLMQVLLLDAAVAFLVDRIFLWLLGTSKLRTS